MTIRGNRRLRAREREERKRQSAGRPRPMTYDARETVWFPLDGGPPSIGEPMPEIGGITFQYTPDEGFLEWIPGRRTVTGTIKVR